MYHKWVSIIIIGLWRVLSLGAEVFGQSTTLCSNGQSYPAGVGGGCCGNGIVDGGSLGGEECDNGVFNGQPITLGGTMCLNECSIKQGCFKALYLSSPLKIYEYSEYLGNCNAPVFTDCDVAVSCVDDDIVFQASAFCKEGWAGTIVDVCCSSNGGSLKTPTGVCAASGSCPSGVYDCNGTCDGTATDYNGASTPRCGSPSSCTSGIYDCNNVCDGTATDYNGATAGCGTPPTAASCSNMPTNAVACNTATPSSNASYSLVENCSSPDVACQARCAGGTTYTGGTTYNGGVCVNNLKAYQCGSDGDWSQPPVSCAQQTSYVNTADYYTAGQSVCLLLSDTAPTNDTCANPTSDVKCGVTPGTCDLGSYVNGSDNGSLACYTTRQWQCRNAANTTTLSCNKTNYCNYACNGSSCEATIAGTYSSPSCDSACVVVDPPRCGDGIVQTNRGEECDGTAGLTAGQSCNASCQN